jgi:hypothetical protein
MKKKWVLILSLFLFEAPVFATIQPQTIVNQAVIQKKYTFRTKIKLLLTLPKSTALPQTMPLFPKDSIECVKITLNNGKKFYGIIKTMTPHQLTYTPCSQPSIEPLELYTKDVATLTDANGKIFYQYRAETEQASVKTKAKISFASALIAPLFLYLLFIGEASTILLLGVVLFPLIGIIAGISSLAYMVRKKYSHKMSLLLAGIGTAFSLILGLLGPFAILIGATLLICGLYQLITFKG